MPRSRAQSGSAKARGNAHLTRVAIDMIVLSINEFDRARRINWDDVVAIAKRLTKRTYSRQALSTHKLIKDAYDEVVTRYRQRVVGKASKEKREPTEAEVRIARLEAEADGLRKTLNDYDERFILIAENARLKGWDIKDLLIPLLVVPKGQTDIGDRRQKKRERSVR